MVLYDQPHLKIEFKNVPFRHLVTTWTGTVKSQQYKDGIQTVLRCCRENEIKKLLSDTRRQEGLSIQDKKFAESAVKDYITKFGVFFQAVVVPSDIFLEFSAENFERNVKSHEHTNQFFSSDRDAMNWLMQVDS